MQKSLLCILSLGLFTLSAMAGEMDSTKVYNLQEIEVLSSPKENVPLRQLPSAVSQLSSRQLADNHVVSLKGISGVVPNLFIPDYGSRLTSAVYIRGIGSRINTPAVGLYVDNIPYTDKSGFDFSFYDIDRIDVMRGPQGTLYGRNTMGGIIKVYTRNPLYYQGTSVNLGYTTRDNRRKISVMHYHRPSDKLAFSAGGYYEGSDGLFTNSYTGKKVDALQSGGGKFRALWLPTKNLNFDFNLTYDYSDEGAYPYFYTGTLSGDENYIQTGKDAAGNPTYMYNLNQFKGKITNNHESRYRRGMFNAGIGLSYKAKNFVMNSVTSYQNLNDRMFMDQDFIQLDVYTIEQKQRVNTLTEELTFRNTNSKRWERVSGVNIMQQWTHTTGPVTFYSDGLRWLESVVNSVFQNPKIPFSMSLAFKGDDLVMGGTFDTPTFNVAAFHQSTYHFNDHLSATVGLRLDYEKNTIDYDAPATINFTYTMPLLDPLDLHSDINEYKGTMHTDYLKVLPKFALKYDINKENNLYFSVTKGMRSGGYNVQGFSEMLQGAMKCKMMEATKAGIVEAWEAKYKTGSEMKALLDRVMPTFEMPDVSEVEYKPEYSWNYEIGTHLSLADNKLKIDAAVYYIHTRDQQVARFVNSGLGRILVNAGKSESYGAELSAMWQITKRLAFTGNYGFTHAKFTDYDAGSSSDSTTVDYTGNYVPYVPQHTVNADLAYTLPLAGANGSNGSSSSNGSRGSGFWKSLTFGVTYSGAGRIYWTEANDASQAFYQQLGARASLNTKLFTLQLWAKNLTNSNYNTFYFQSAGRGFEQHCKPLQVGIDIKFVF